MTGWEEVVLSDIARIQSGFAFKSRDWTDAGVPVIKIQNVRSGRVLLDGCSYVSEAVASSAPRFELHRHDVLVTMSGEIGAVGIVSAATPMMLNQRVGRVEVLDPKRTSVRFLGYALQHRDTKKTMENIAYGVAQPNISPRLLGSLPIRLPKRAVQDRICGVLDAIDDLIENNRRRIELLEQMAQAIYREWFVQFRYPGHENATFIDSQLGPIPEGWRACSVREVLNFHIGGGWGLDEPEGKNVVQAAVIRGTDIPRARTGDLSSVPIRYHTTSNARSRMLAVGDLVMEVSGGSKGQPVGRALLISDSVLKRLGPTICASFCKRLVPNPELVSPEAFYLDLRELYGSRRIEEFQVQSTGITNLKFETFLDGHHVLVPTSRVHDDFIAVVRPILELVESLGASAASLRSTRDLVLPKLVMGQIDVSTLDLEALMGSVA